MVERERGREEGGPRDDGKERERLLEGEREVEEWTRGDGCGGGLAPERAAAAWVRWGWPRERRDGWM